MNPIGKRELARRAEWEGEKNVRRREERQRESSDGFKEARTRRKEKEYAVRSQALR